MALPRDYTGQACSLARSLELVGERWTLLIVRDAFYGVRRFSDFLAHLNIPRAVLAERLAGLVAAGILAREPGPGGHDEYVTTDKGRALWPVVHSLIVWGDTYCASRGPRRVFMHAACGTPVDAVSFCPACGVPAAVADLTVSPGPGLEGEEVADPVTEALTVPHRMLDPINTRHEHLLALPAGHQDLEGLVFLMRARGRGMRRGLLPRRSSRPAGCGCGSTARRAGVAQAGYAWSGRCCRRARPPGRPRRWRRACR